jgi:hypothetical membrane protein
MITTNRKKIFIVSMIIMFLIITIVGLYKSKNDTETPQVQLLAQAGTLTANYVPLSGTSIFERSDLGSLSKMLGKIFNWTIAIIIALAVVFILFGSIQYMTTDAVFEKRDGLTKIQSAISGLILALVSWLILNTINPELLKMNIGNIQQVERTTAGQNN